MNGRVSVKRIFSKSKYISFHIRCYNYERNKSKKIYGYFKLKYWIGSGCI